MKKHKVKIKRVDGIRQHYWKNYGMPVISKTTVPVVDYPEKYNSIKAKLIINMPPQKYFDTLKDAFIKSAESRGDTKEVEHLKSQTKKQFRDSLGGLYEDDIKEKMEQLKKGEDVPTGYIETGMVTNQEGKKHMSVSFDVPGGIEAARRLKIKQVPVVLLKGRPYTSTGLMRGDWEFSESELKKRADEEARTVIEGITSKEFDKGTIHTIHAKRLKKGAQPGSKYESDYEDDPEDTWREVTVVDLTKEK